MNTTDRLRALNDEAHRLLPAADERIKAALHEACKWLSVAVLADRKRGELKPQATGAATGNKVSFVRN